MKKRDYTKYIYMFCAISFFSIAFPQTTFAGGDSNEKPGMLDDKERFDSKVSERLNLNYELDLRSVALNDKIHDFVHGAAVGGTYYFQKETSDLASFHFFTGVGERPDSRRFLSHYGDYFLVLNGHRGKINLKVGRFNLPFGLIATYDSHRRLTQSFYNISLGIRKDTGLAIFGYFNEYLYELSYTNGSGRLKFRPETPQLLTARVGGETDSSTYGLSIALGQAPEGTHEVITDVDKPLAGVDMVHKNFGSLDASYQFGSYSFSGEAVYGREHGFFHHGFFSALDYRISRKSLLTGSAGTFRSGGEVEFQSFIGIEAAYFPTGIVDLRSQLLYFSSEEKGISHVGSMLTLSVSWRY